MDETGMLLDPRPPKVAVPKGWKKVRYRCSGQKSQITVIGCGNATGQTIPPYTLALCYPYQRRQVQDDPRAFWEKSTGCYCVKQGNRRVNTGE